MTEWTHTHYIGRNKVLLRGVVGSTAYGLAGPDSDVDQLGMYAAPTIDFHGLHPPIGKEASVVFHDPDFTMHEAGKFAKLCLGGNPTVMELLWLEQYNHITSLGAKAVDIRKSFLCAKKVRGAYLGYATAQFKKLETRDDGSFSADTRKRTAKHARHLMRLCYQGYILYATGKLVVKLEVPVGFRMFGDRVAGGDIQAARNLISTYEDKFERTQTVLPPAPDERAVTAWLHEVRRDNYNVY